MFEMKDEYRLGVSNIDEEHEKLFEIGERAYTLLKDPYIIDKYDKIVDVISELKDYTAYHFKNEEEYMQSINYKRLFTQKIEHEGFIKKLNELDLNKIDENQDEYIMDVLKFLNNWIINHIVEKDLLIVSK
ncbi:bacteriohemerythrin [Clostridium sp. FAM 1755]|uniref:bacteriohemerythrin n=1 Tax=Clostridium TaxID=1485 RepID=UPI0006AB7A62|nr:hemerythrin family protein [Clostridium sp. L74]KOR25193.1 bacteriohemerythrin [Clostridium sp. L74]